MMHVGQVGEDAVCMRGVKQAVLLFGMSCASLPVSQVQSAAVASDHWCWTPVPSCCCICFLMLLLLRVDALPADLNLFAYRV